MSVRSSSALANFASNCPGVSVPLAICWYICSNSVRCSITSPVYPAFSASVSKFATSPAVFKSCNPHNSFWKVSIAIAFDTFSADTISFAKVLICSSVASAKSSPAFFNASVLFASDSNATSSSFTTPRSSRAAFSVSKSSAPDNPALVMEAARESNASFTFCSVDSELRNTLTKSS